MTRQLIYDPSTRLWIMTLINVLCSGFVKVSNIAKISSSFESVNGPIDILHGIIAIGFLRWLWLAFPSYCCPRVWLLVDTREGSVKVSHITKIFFTCALYKSWCLMLSQDVFWEYQWAHELFTGFVSQPV